MQREYSLHSLFIPVFISTLLPCTNQASSALKDAEERIKRMFFLNEYKCIPAAFLLIALLFAGCKNTGNTTATNPSHTLFTFLPSQQTGITSTNTISYTEEFNPYTFRNFFNGGGVAVGDINNDGLPDLFFCYNQQSNKLYLNKGNFQFEDITQQAGVTSDGVWSTGVTMVDVNGDGLLDIYVCKSGDPRGKKRSNELFINNGPVANGHNKGVTFTESAHAYGLDHKGLSTHAAFFDYDRDGDLDCYLLNNSFRSVGNYDLIYDQRNVPDTLGGNKFFRNDNARFIDITSSAGIYSSRIGFGLGVTVSDVNNDGWQDIFVSNDFFERDYLYINQQDGTFKESLETYMREISMNSMGADIADINNDGYPEIYVTDMLPETESRIKTKTTFENWNKYQSNIKSGYYKQFIRNSLQLNSGPVHCIDGKSNEVYFSEIGRYSGVSASDWSWGALITDLDNDGFKDIYVANGIYKDVTDQDYIQYTANSATDIRQQILNKEKNIITKLIDLIPSEAVSNYAFHNKGDLTFENKAKAWGLDEPSFSNGSAYGDLDNDGDLDLVVNNVNMPCFVYRNETVEQLPENKYLKVSLQGQGKNSYGIGAKVKLYYKATLAYQEQMPMRGFESSVDYRLNFGLGKTKRIDSLLVQWPDGKEQVLKNILPNQHITLKQQEANLPASAKQGIDQPLFSQTTNKYGIDFIHQENAFSDFDRDKLIFHMLSRQGPALAKADVNGDGREDFYIGGAKDQAGALFLQTKAGSFQKSNQALLEADAGSEDTDALFFDADKDADMDLYVCSGGNEFSPNAAALLDRLYLNDGKGGFTKSAQLLPSFIFESSSAVSAADYDKDGDMDLFVGVRLKAFRYGYPCKSYILQNDGKATFSDVTSQLAPALLSAGMVSDGEWLDYDRDGAMDLVIAGEYMPLRLFHNKQGKLEEVTQEAALGKTHGWWNRLAVADVNGDGYTDIIGANHGLNSRFKASEDKPVEMYAADFDNNGSIEQLISSYNKEKPYPMVLRHDLLSVLPALKKKYLKYERYQGQQIEDIFTNAQLGKAERWQAYLMESSVFVNQGGGSFSRKALPKQAQLSAMYGIGVEDYDGDGVMDLLLGGNFYESKPEVGIYDGSYGLLLKGKGDATFSPIPAQQSGINIRDQIRNILPITLGSKKFVLIASNNAPLNILSINGQYIQRSFVTKDR